MSSTGCLVQVDLARIRHNAQAIAARVAVPVYAVVKADAYGLGAAAVAGAIADVVDGFCIFALHEAVEAQLWQRTGKPSIALGPPVSLDPQVHVEHHVRPAVSTAQQAEALRAAHPLLCVDTGMQRFACPPDRIDQVLRAGDIREAFTHAVNLDQVRRFVQLAGGKGLRLHAAASSLLDEPQAWLDAVRPGLALYRDAVKVSSPLIEVHHSAPPVGYAGFHTQRHGVILCGYSHGLRRGPCLVNGRPSRIMEVGMQSAYVEIAADDRVADDVILLGQGLAPEEVAAAWGATPHEVLLRLSAAGR